MATNEYLQFLTDLKANSPLFPNNMGSIMCILDNQSVSEAFHKLVEGHILSAPVIDHKTAKILGVVTMRSLLTLFLDTFSPQDLESAPLQTLVQKKAEFNHMKVTDLEKEDDSSLVIVPESATALETGREMLRMNAHRAIVIRDDGRPVNIITESRLVKIASVLLDALPQTKKSLKELKINEKDVVTVNENQTTREAFKLIKDKKVTAVGVVNNEGKLVGNLSTQDIKFLGFDARYFEGLTSSVKNYLEKLRIYDASRSIPESFDPIRCSEDQTLGSVITLLIHYKIHRVYVVDKDQKPIGVVSMQDILRLLLQ